MQLYFQGIMQSFCLALASRPSNGTIAFIMNAVFIVSAIISALVTRKIKNKKRALKSAETDSDEESDKD